jgi:hypothetical protein
MTTTDSEIILNYQNKLVSNINYYKNRFYSSQDKICNFFKDLIAKKTGEEFFSENINNFYIYYNKSYIIIFNINTLVWGLTKNNTLLIEDYDFNKIIYKYLEDTNRLAIVIYQYMGDEMEEINNMLNDIKL